MGSSSGGGNAFTNALGAVTSPFILGQGILLSEAEKLTGGNTIGRAADPLGNLGGSNPEDFLTVGLYPLATRIRQDQRDQAEGQAEKEQRRAADAQARAVDASVKDLDPIALERRRRAAVGANKGRSGTILTAGTSLGSADIARKTLLGQ